MLKLHLFRSGLEGITFSEPTVEEAAHQMRRLAHEAIAEHGQSGRDSQITLYVGKHPGGAHDSLPRRHHMAAIAEGLSQVSLVALVDRSLHLMNHPAVKEITFHADTSPDRLQITDNVGQTFEVIIRRT